MRLLREYSFEYNGYVLSIATIRTELFNLPCLFTYLAWSIRCTGLFTIMKPREEQFYLHYYLSLMEKLRRLISKQVTVPKILQQNYRNLTSWTLDWLFPSWLIYCRVNTRHHLQSHTQRKVEWACTALVSINLTVIIKLYYIDFMHKIISLNKTYRRQFYKI